MLKERTIAMDTVFSRSINKLTLGKSESKICIPREPLTVISDKALVMESAKIVLLSVKRAKVTEFCMIKTTYSTRHQTRASRIRTEK